MIDSTIATLYPGGILNTGFALGWGKERAHDALPASPTGGQPWALQRIRGGDRTCAANQALHAWFTFTNGVHVDSLDPATFNRWYDFLELNVAHRRPSLSASARALAPLVYQSTMGISGVTLPPDSLQAQPSYAAARAAFERLPAIRILFDNGAASPVPGAPWAAFEQSFARFPIPGTGARSWFLSAGGGLAATAPAQAGADRFIWRRRPARRRTSPARTPAPPVAYGRPPRSTTGIPIRPARRPAT